MANHRNYLMVGNHSRQQLEALSRDDNPDTIVLAIEALCGIRLRWVSLHPNKFTFDSIIHFKYGNFSKNVTFQSFQTEWHFKRDIYEQREAPANCWATWVIIILAKRFVFAALFGEGNRSLRNWWVRKFFCKSRESIFPRILECFL